MKAAERRLRGQNAEQNGKRVVLIEPNRPVEVWERPIKPPGLDEVLLRTQLAGVCGTDVHLWRGEVPFRGPVVLGHEGVGTIEEGALYESDCISQPTSPRPNRAGFVAWSVSS